MWDQFLAFLLSKCAHIFTDGFKRTIGKIFCLLIYFQNAMVSENGLTHKIILEKTLSEKIYNIKKYYYIIMIYELEALVLSKAIINYCKLLDMEFMKMNTTHAYSLFETQSQ